MAMNLVRLRIKPLGSWLTPWQADTLLGALASVCARAYGTQRLERDLLEPWQAGEPPFVLSDAFPGDFLPAPACLSLWPWPEEKRKVVKRSQWLSQEQFRDLQSGRQPVLSDETTKKLQSDVRMRNTLDRQLDSTGLSGSLYETPATVLAQNCPCLSLYAKIAAGKEALLGELMGCLTEFGFGADASVGQGHFEWDGRFEDASWLTKVDAADGWISLSTFQPDHRDPTDGYWRSFVKYGKLGPDFGVEGVFKRPQWMLRPGSCFREEGIVRDWYGRVIGGSELLSASTANELAASGVHPVQAVFACAVPMKWTKEYKP